MPRYLVPRWRVTVSTDGHPDWPIEVSAFHEEAAKTLAMRHYPYRLHGALVQFAFERLG